MASPRLVHGRHGADEPGVTEAHPLVLALGHEDLHHGGVLEVDVAHVVEHAGVEHAAAGGGLAPQRHAAAMEPLGEEIGVAAVAPRDARRVRQGVTLFEEPRRDVRQLAALDVRHAVDKPCAGVERLAPADQIQHSFGEHVHGVAQAAPWAAPIWAGVPETIKIVLPWQRHSRPWPAGSRATTEMAVDFRSARWPSAAVGPLDGEIQHRREDVVQIRLLHVLTVFPLGRLEHRIGSDRVRLPAAETERPSNAGDVELGLGRRAALVFEAQPDFARRLPGILRLNVDYATDVWGLAVGAGAAGARSCDSSVTHCWSISGTITTLPTSPAANASFVRSCGSTNRSGLRSAAGFFLPASTVFPPARSQGYRPCPIATSPTSGSLPCSRNFPCGPRT